MAFRVNSPIPSDSTSVGMVWLSKTKIFLIEIRILPNNLRQYVPWMSYDGGRTWKRRDDYYPDRGYMTAQISGAGSFFKGSMTPILTLDPVTQDIYAICLDEGPAGNHVIFRWAKQDGDNWIAADGGYVNIPLGCQHQTGYQVIDADRRLYTVFLRNAPNENSYGTGGVIVFRHTPLTTTNFGAYNYGAYNLPDSAPSASFLGSGGLGVCVAANGRVYAFYGRQQNNVSGSTGGTFPHVSTYKNLGGDNWTRITCATIAGETYNPLNGFKDLEMLDTNAGLRGYWSFIRAVARNDGTIVLVCGQNNGYRVGYAVFDTNTNKWQTRQPIIIYTNTTQPTPNGGLPVSDGNFKIAGPFIQSDGTNCVISWITQDYSTLNWTVRSRRLRGDGVLESEIQYETFANTSWINTTQSSNPGSAGGRSFPGYDGSKVYDRMLIGYPHSELQSSGMYQLQVFDNNYAPLAPTPAQLTGGATTDDLTPDISWKYNDQNLEDYQTAFQVEVYDQSTGTKIHDSGKITGATCVIYGYTIPAAAGLAYNKYYQWRVRTYDSFDTTGAWSTMNLFKTSATPTVTITVPGNGGHLSSNTPTFQWSYSQANSQPQIAYRIRIWQQVTNNALYDSGWVYSAATSQDIPSGIMANGGAYYAEVDVISKENITGYSGQPYFDVQFISPPVPLLSVRQDRLGAYNELSITQTTPFNDSLSADFMRIYRQETGQTSGFILLKDNVTIPARVLENMENAARWLPNSGTTTPSLSTNSKQGSYSVNFGTAAGATKMFVTYDNYGVNGPDSSDYSNYDKIHLWFYIQDKSQVGLVRFRFGNDSNNYFRYDHDISYMQNGAWNLLSIPFNTAIIVGEPNINSLKYVAIDIDVAASAQTAGIALGNIKIDQMRLLKDNLLIQDYQVGNDRTYTYRIVTVNQQNNVESTGALSNALTTQFPDQVPDLRNTYLTPVGNESTQVGAWQDAGQSGANWKRSRDTDYYKAVNRRTPVVYKSGIEDYRSGSMTVLFYDTNLPGVGAGQGLDGAHAIERLLQYSPLLLRTWWGDIIPVSIDADMNISRMKGKAWVAAFNWTETEPVSG